MLMSSKPALIAWIAAPTLGVMASGAALAQPQVCDAKTARIAANAADYGAMCACTHVTPSFLSHLQNRPDFETTLANTAGQCPGLAGLLSDIPTAAISGPSNFEGREEDFASSAPGADTDPGRGNPGNDDPNSGSDNPGGDGGTGPGDSPGTGDDGPGGGDGKPGNGGDKPGKGGDRPGKGGDKPGKGHDGKPGKGGPGGGHGDKPGKGGGKGNNGGGNGSEGSSPGRGHNANDDEH